ncbi:MAG TPA: oligosaccharide flippase family protein [Planctomycetota bacterium]|nr:oligosaccharide flippase family protein [Planctomycetota bacterium]
MRGSVSENAILTLVGTSTQAACQWGIVILLAKLGSADIVGRFSLALAISAPVFVFSGLNLRAVHATDAHDERSVRDYVAVRLLTSLVGLAGVLLIPIAIGYSGETAWVIALVALNKAVESLSDILYGTYQRYEAMRPLAVSLVLRGVLSVAAVALALLHTHRLVPAVAMLVASAGVTLVFHDIPAARRLLRASGAVSKVATFREALAPSWDGRALRAIVTSTVPLGASIMILSLNANIPRYFIEHSRGEHDLGIYASISYLAIVGGTMANAVTQAASPRLAHLYAERAIQPFRSLVSKLMAFAAALGVTGSIVAAAVGPELLSRVYRPEFAAHGRTLNIVMFGAALSYFGGFLGTAITSMRFFAIQLPLNAVAVLVTAVASATLVPVSGIDGAAWATVLGSGAGSVAFGVAFIALRRAEPAESRSMVDPLA